jgi:hypothetical protein
MIGPNNLTGWSGLWNWSNCAVAKANCCGPTWGCGSFVHCQPKPPKILFPRVCNCHGVADVCALDHFGYYANCWAAWGYPPDCSYCPTPQLASNVPSGPTPKVEYFSPDPRAQQPQLGNMEREKEKEILNAPVGYEPRPLPLPQGPMRSRP